MKKYSYIALFFILLSSSILLISQFEKQRHIVVVIPSYNNERWCIQNLESVLKQKYGNYRVVYIDDCSTDRTHDLVKSYLQMYDAKQLVTFTRNSERKGALYNLYNAIHACDDRTIILTLDGDDWLMGDNALQIINDAYTDPNVWMTYGQFQEFPRGNLGICRPLPESVVALRTYRTQPWVTSHARTFYAGLFKRVKEQDLRDENGNFYSVTWDQAFMFPLLEMANGHLKFIDKIIYVYNQVNPLNDFKQKLRLQLYCEQMIRHKQRYEPLDPSIACELFVVS